MKIKEALEKPIIIYWWNFGKRTLDFKGTYEDYLKKRNIKINPLKKENWFRIKFSCGSSNHQVDIYSNWYIDVLDVAIKQFLTYLGDRTIFEGYNKTYKLNWN